MPNAAKALKDSVFNDFIYSVLYNASYQEKRGLRGGLLKASMNQRAAKYFAHNASWEEKQELLAHFGIENYTVFVKTGSVNMKRLGDILKTYEKDGEKLALQDIVNERIFVTSDAQFVQLFRLMSKSIHKPQYFLNLELTRAGYHINKWKRRNVNKDDMAVREALQCANLLARYALSAAVKMEYTKATAGVKSFDLQILMYFFIQANNYIPEVDVLRYFAGYRTARVIKNAMGALLKSQNLQKNLANPNELCITGVGITNIHNFMDELMDGIIL